MSEPITGEWRNDLSRAQKDLREFIKGEPLGERDSYKFEKQRVDGEMQYRFAITKGGE